MARVPGTTDLLVKHQRDIAWLVDERERTTLELGSRLAPQLHSMTRAGLIAVLADPGNRELPAELLGYYVAAARAAGATWREIGDSLGVSRQAAHKRFVSFEDHYRRACVTHQSQLPQGGQSARTQHGAAPYPALTAGLTSRRGHDSDVRIGRATTRPARKPTRQDSASTRREV